MREKLLDLMKNEGLKPSQLAEMLEINPAGVSHILAGRNKPGFDLLQKILRRFPRISPDWLLLDTGSMYRAETGTIPTTSAAAAPSASTVSNASRIPTKDGGLFGLFSGDASESQVASASTPSDSPVRPSGETRPFVPTTDGASVTRVVIFYDDQTFEYYSPTRR